MHHLAAFFLRCTFEQVLIDLFWLSTWNLCPNACKNTQLAHYGLISKIQKVATEKIMKRKYSSVAVRLITNQF